MNTLLSTAPLVERRPPLSELTFSELAGLIRDSQLRPYRASQIYQALHRQGVWEIDRVSTLPTALRLRLVEEFDTRTISPLLHLHSRTDGSQKVLFRLRDGHSAESVLIRSRSGKPRETVCVSSQVGCPAACSFCATGLGGFHRNLTAAEIADQVAYFAGHLEGEGRKVTNVVFMGMGEPLLNVGAVRSAIGQLTDPTGLGLGDRRITVSTVGIVPQIRKFADWAGQVNLAVSLHAPNDELRSRLVPYNSHFPIADLMQSVTDYVNRTRRRVSFEYVLLKATNDTPQLAVELATLLRPLGGMAHVNLIPWNPFREGRFVRSEGPDAESFARILRGRGIVATIRFSKGLDISAACGQLREQVKNDEARA